MSENMSSVEIKKDTCPYCGKPTAINEKFCEHCDSLLGREWLSKHGVDEDGEKKLYNQPKSPKRAGKSANNSKICVSCKRAFSAAFAYCPHCGEGADLNSSGEQYYYYGQDKTGEGIVYALFLGVIGLIIGLCMFKGYERETFLAGWLKTYIIVGIVSVALVIGACFIYVVVLGQTLT